MGERAASDWILDVGEADFEREVLARSESVPVVVDFWAPWCAPCRVLAPILERAVERHQGALVLAKVNADEAPRLAQALGVRGIPAIRAVRGRAVVAEFEGAQPEATVARFLAALLPTEADRHARTGDAAWQAGDAAAAEDAYRAALALDVRHAPATLGLARVLAARGDAAGALEQLEGIVAGTAVSEQAARLAAELRTSRAGAGDEAALRERIRASGGDLDARLALGQLLAGRGRHEEALEELLELVRRDPHHAGDGARLAMLDLFSLLGSDHPLTQRFRPALARALFR
jgi:putative thioredoxin